MAIAAVVAQRMDLVSLLLRYRANPDLADVDGQTALSVAVEAGSAEALAAIGGDPQVRFAFFRRLLDLARNTVHESDPPPELDS